MSPILTIQINFSRYWLDLYLPIFLAIRLIHVLSSSTTKIIKQNHHLPCSWLLFFTSDCISQISELKTWLTIQFESACRKSPISTTLIEESLIYTTSSLILKPSLMLQPSSPTICVERVMNTMLNVLPFNLKVCTFSSELTASMEFLICYYVDIAARIREMLERV